MPLFGTLKTMALPDLLQWLSTARMTGTLQVERNKVRKLIILADGEVVGCSSDDPPELLGQFLLARGKISEEQLRLALESQERERKHLGLILVEMGFLSPDELSAHLEAKAEETIYSLFDWRDAVFRFQQGETDQPNVFPVRLPVEDVLLRGLRRFDEVQRIREVLNDPGIVLRRTARVPPREVFENRMARSLYEAIDGERTVAEILLHVHGSEYIVTKFLFELNRNGFAEIIGTKPVPDVNGVPVSAGSTAEPVSGEKQAPAAADPAPPVVETPAGCVDTQADSGVAVAAPPTQSPAVEPGSQTGAVAVREPAGGPAPAGARSEPAERPEVPTLTERLETVRRQMSAGEYEPVLDLLDGLYAECPGDESLRRLTAEAEAAFIEKAYRHYLPPAKVPVLTRPMESLESENLSPSEFFLLSRIDGTWELKSIIQIAPLREVECLRTLKRLRETGVIELRDPE